MNTWFRFYHETLDDPKVQSLSGELFKFWINLLSLACRHAGRLPSLDDIAFGLRLPLPIVSENIRLLCKARLIDKTDQGLRPHAWDKRQFQSDNVTDRVKRFRQRYKVVSGNSAATLDETPPDTDTDTDTDTEQKNTGEAPPAILALGEHGFAKMTGAQKQRLHVTMNGAAESLIVEFDLWVAAAPNAKSSGVCRKDRNAYATIQAWYARRIREGHMTPQARLPIVEQQDAQREAWAQLAAKVNQ